MLVARHDMLAGGTTFVRPTSAFHNPVPLRSVLLSPTKVGSIAASDQLFKVPATTIASPMYGGACAACSSTAPTSGGSFVATRCPDLVFRAEAPRSPQISFGAHSGGDLKESDPFFYPTTSAPLTQRSANLVDLSSPSPTARVSSSPVVAGSRSARSLSLGPRCLRLDQPGIAPPPAASSREDLGPHFQKQIETDNLSKQLQALEEAKNLAALQNEQQQRNIRARQEQMRREAQLAEQARKRFRNDMDEFLDLFNTPTKSPDDTDAIDNQALPSTSTALQVEHIDADATIEPLVRIESRQQSSPALSIEAPAVDSKANFSSNVPANRTVASTTSMAGPPIAQVPIPQVQNVWSVASFLGQPLRPPVVSVVPSSLRPCENSCQGPSCAVGSSSRIHVIPGSGGSVKLFCGGSLVASPAPTGFCGGTAMSSPTSLNFSGGSASVGVPFLAAARPAERRREASAPPQTSSAGQLSACFGATPLGGVVMGSPPEGGLTDRPQWRRDVWENSSSMPLAGPCRSRPQSPQADRSQLLSSLNGSENVVEDTERLANRLLESHRAQTPHAAKKATPGSVAMLPSGVPYVDALGNPLPLVTEWVLPNIKDDAPSTSALSAFKTKPVEEATFVEKEFKPPIDFQTPSLDLPVDSAPTVLAESTVARTPLSGNVLTSAASSAAQKAHERKTSGIPQPKSARRPSESRVANDRGDASARTTEASSVVTLPSQPPTPADSLRSARRLLPQSQSQTVEPAGVRRKRPTTTTVGGAVADTMASARADAGPSTITETRVASQQSQPQIQAPFPDTELDYLQAELESCLDTIKWSAETVTKDSLQELTKSNAKLAPIVKEVLETVSILLGQPETSVEKLKKLIATPNFLDRIRKLNIQTGVTKDQFKKLTEKLQNPELDEEFIKTVCVAVVPLASWCRSIAVYLSQTKYPGGPPVRPLAAGGTAPAPPPQRLQQPGANIVIEPNLSSLSTEDLRAVKELTISRNNVGSVTFHGETDCTGLDFDRLVKLELGEILVYPDGAKPPTGSGLNKHATVTMYQCFPPSGGKVLKDKKSQDRYKAKIKQMTEEKNATFIDYDCASGVWVFSVDHF